MTKINTYGLKMTGLREAAGETKCLSRYRSPYVQISYDKKSGEVITNYHASENNWSDYHNADIYTVCRASVPMTMQQIADAIKKETEYENELIEELEERQNQGGFYAFQDMMDAWRRER